ncbi:MAG TPA: class I SAM-dependent methyltransferase [Candidatus Edwardsbacteria bacterium]|nr:class I SAM-dependent methyltransferase [Candidatus Edwardsbacteria bacterium]
MKSVARHFEQLAPRYDRLKRRQAFYNEQLEHLAASLAGDVTAGSVLDLGCSTGRILRSLELRSGLGVDISPAMIELASRGAPPQLAFRQADVMAFVPDRAFDAVICCDVIEHLPDYRALLERLRQYPGNPRIVLTWPNPRWFPAMRVGELLRLKTPEGRLFGRSLRTVARTAVECGLRVVRSGYRLLLPVPVPWLTDTLNHWHRRGLLRRWGLIQYLVLSK